MAEGTKVGTGYVDIEGNFAPLHRQLERLRGTWAQQTKGVGESFSRSLSPALDNVTRRVRENTTAARGLGAEMNRTRQSVDRAKTSLGGFGDELKRARDEVRTAAGWRPAGLEALARDLDRVRNTSTRLGTDLRRSSTQARGGLLGAIGALKGWNSSTTRARSDALQLERAQIALELAARRHGAASLQARDAQIRLAQAQDRVDSSSRGAMRSLTGLGSRTTVVNQRFQLLRNALGALRWPAIITGAGLAAQALSALGASLVAVTAAVGPAVGVLAAVPGALAAAAQGFGVFRLATMGVADALREQLRSQFAVASGASKAADASRQVEQAERAQADASRQLVQAKEQVGDAERALIIARRDARRSLEDQRRAVVTATRDEERATLDLRDARAALRALQAGPDELDLADARDRTADATRAIADAENDYAEALARSNSVLADPNASPLEQARARADLADAEDRIGDSRRALTRATRDLDQLERGPSRRDLARARLDVLDAEGRLTDAIVTRKRATAELQEMEARGIDRAEQVIQAQRALRQAHQGVRDAELAVRDAAHGVSDAQQGVVTTAANLNEEFDRLPRSAQAFVRTLIGLKPRFDELRTTAADGLFPGARAGLLSAMGAFEPIRRVVSITSRTLGGLAAQAGRLIGSRGFGRDLQLIGTRNATVIRRVGRAAILTADALRHVMVAAGPLLGWLSRVTVGWARSWREQAKAGRESGRMARFFESTRRVLERLGSITGNVTRAFRGIGRAAAPLGNEILAALDRASERFANWTNSLGGQRTLRRYFDDARPAIFEMGRLLRDITVSFFRLGSQPGVARLLRQVRTELLPALERLLGVLQQTFGPALISALTSVVGLFSQLAGAGGILSSIVRMFDAMASAATWLLKNVPGFRQLTFAVIALGGAFAALRIAAVITGFATLTRTLVRVAAAYRALRAGQAAAAVASSTGLAATGAAQVAASGRMARLFSFGGMLRAAGGRAGVAATGSRLGRLLGGSIGRSTTAALGGTGGALAGAIPAGGFAGRLAGRLAAGLRRALPGAIAAAGIGNIVMSAAEGDTKKAMWETGGAAAGGLVGGLVGGLPGALVGSGLGSLAGGLLGKTFGGAADSAGKEIADRMAASISVRLRARLTEIANGEPLAIAQDNTRRAVGPAARGGRATAPVSPAVRDRAGNTSDAARRLNSVYEQMQRTRVRMSQAEVASLRAAAQSLNLTRDERREVNRIIGLLERGSRLRIGVSIGDSSRTLARLGNAFRLLRSGALTNIGDILRVSRRNSRLIAQALGTGTREGRRQTARNMRATADAVETAMRRAGVRTRDGMALVRRYIRNANLLDPSRKMAREFGKGWAEGMDASHKITRRGLDRMLAEARKMPGPMRKVALDTWLTQLEAARKNGRITKREFEDLRSKVATEFTGMRTASREASRRVPENVGNMTTASTGALSVLAGNTNKALQAFGVRPLFFRFEKVREQRRQRGGGIVPGTGSGDTHRTVLPAGSFVLNRNATAAFGFNKGGMVPVALEPRERVFTPDEVRRIGLGRLQSMNAAVPRFGGRRERHQTGGLAGGFNVDGARPGFVPLMNYLNKLFGPIYVMSGLRPGSITTSGNVSNHASGRAVDISTTQDGLNFAYNAATLNATGVAARRMDALYAHMARWIPTSRVPGDFLWRTDTGGNHWNHIHRGITNGLADSAAAMMQFLSTLPEGGGFGGLQRLLLTGPDGPLRRLGQAAINRVYQAASRYVTDRSSVPMFGTGTLVDVPHGGKVVGASTFGGSGDPGTGSQGYRGDNLSGKDAYAELRMGTALGGLPYRTPLTIAHGNRAVRAEKLDIGLGGAPIQGHSTDIDIWHETARKLGLPGVWKGLVSISGLLRGGLVQRLRRGGMPRVGGGVGDALSRMVDPFAGLTISSAIDRLGRVRRKPLKRRVVTGLIARTLRLIEGTGVPASLQGRLTDLSNQSDVWAEYASRAGSLSYEMLYGERTPYRWDASGRPTAFHEPGDPILDAERRPMTYLAEVNGQNEAGWTNARLGALFDLRNKLVEAKDRVMGEQSRVRALIEQTRRRIAEITQAIRRAERRRRRLLGQIRRTERAIADARESLAELRRRPRRNRARIERTEGRLAGLTARLGGLREQVGEIDQQQQNRTRVRSHLNAVLGTGDGGTRTGLLGRQAAMDEYLPQLLGTQGDSFKGLVTVQGLGGPEGLLSALPPIGTLGGEIFDAQQILRQLAVKPDPVPAPDETDAETSADDSERNALLAQMLQETQQRLATSQAQYPAFAQFLRDFPLERLPGFGGSFATGGVVPGAVGEARTIIAHGGERVLSVAEQRAAGAGAGDGTLRVLITDQRTIAIGPDGQEVRAIVRDETRKQALVGRRGMPGLAGAR